METDRLTTSDVVLESESLLWADPLRMMWEKYDDSETEHKGKDYFPCTCPQYLLCKASRRGAPSVVCRILSLLPPTWKLSMSTAPAGMYGLDRDPEVLEKLRTDERKNGTRSRFDREGWSSLLLPALRSENPKKALAWLLSVGVAEECPEWASLLKDLIMKNWKRDSEEGGWGRVSLPFLDFLMSCKVLDFSDVPKLLIELGQLEDLKRLKRRYMKRILWNACDSVSNALKKSVPPSSEGGGGQEEHGAMIGSGGGVTEDAGVALSPSAGGNVGEVMETAQGGDPTQVADGMSSVQIQAGLLGM
uniref:Uncharacterized protein n=1 Tax=Chromera velia CCMP2878 TaxID=1169474 RepID=A0A0G4HCB0_9ALVE|eukprot:Cvel_26054.t1-p1 / transcript=Cvel_26054.t1 / gene=Cvel_26054 / organism=Chromera_velia_CCMP2878 / gene_product=hypothetical protein / transcript_product=hypothetical protein / location=Cvel_scaffold3037:17311-18390(+) / protein_length=303 / sequence_SO=supercontig / SO=protein_coding / is_pseudo=false